jgi:hypothetical protein
VPPADTLYHRVERDGNAWVSREHIETPALVSIGR